MGIRITIQLGDEGKQVAEVVDTSRGYPVNIEVRTNNVRTAIRRHHDPVEEECRHCDYSSPDSKGCKCEKCVNPRPADTRKRSNGWRHPLSYNTPPPRPRTPPPPDLFNDAEEVMSTGGLNEKSQTGFCNRLGDRMSPRHWYWNDCFKR